MTLIKETDEMCGKKTTPLISDRLDKLVSEKQ